MSFLCFLEQTGWRCFDKDSSLSCNVILFVASLVKCLHFVFGVVAMAARFLLSLFLFGVGIVIVLARDIHGKHWEDTSDYLYSVSTN